MGGAQQVGGVSVLDDKIDSAEWSTTHNATRGASDASSAAPATHHAPLTLSINDFEPFVSNVYTRF